MGNTLEACCAQREKVISDNKSDIFSCASSKISQRHFNSKTQPLHLHQIFSGQLKDEELASKLQKYIVHKSETLTILRDMIGSSAINQIKNYSNIDYVVVFNNSQIVEQGISKVFTKEFHDLSENIKDACYFKFVVS